MKAEIEAAERSDYQLQKYLQYAGDDGNLKDREKET